VDFKKGKKVFLDYEKLSKRFADTKKMYESHGVKNFIDDKRFDDILKLVKENEQFKITKVMYDGRLLNLKGIKSGFEMSCEFDEVIGE